MSHVVFQSFSPFKLNSSEHDQNIKIGNEHYMFVG